MRGARTLLSIVCVASADQGFRRIIQIKTHSHSRESFVSERLDRLGTWRGPDGVAHTTSSTHSSPFLSICVQSWPDKREEGFATWSKRYLLNLLFDHLELLERELRHGDCLSIGHLCVSLCVFVNTFPQVSLLMGERRDSIEVNNELLKYIQTWICREMNLERSL